MAPSQVSPSVLIITHCSVACIAYLLGVLAARGGWPWPAVPAKQARPATSAAVPVLAQLADGDDLAVEARRQAELVRKVR